MLDPSPSVFGLSFMQFLASEEILVRKKVESLSTQPVELAVPRSQVERRLNERMKLGVSFIEQQASSYDDYELLNKEYQKWNVYNAELLKQLFTTADFADQYNASTMSSMVIGSYRQETLAEKIGALKDRFDKKIHRLDLIVNRLELYTLVSSVDEVQGRENSNIKSQLEGNKVFIVHGRDDGAKANLETFIREIGLDPIVLHRQADGGLTVIEKFEKHSDVGYAFILLTPDELAYLGSESSKPEEDRAVERRARPNVIFEWGYFVGKLGRPRVCCILTGDVDLPSDMSGLVTKRYQTSVEEVGWAIIKDLKSAGYKV
jgi:predicted nucleotide-binding protein